MTAPIDPNTLTDRRDQAACWYERLRSADVTEAERAGFERWRSDPRNAEAWRRVLRVWTIAAALPAGEVRKLGEATAQPPRKAVRPRRRALGFGLELTACSVVVFCIAADPMGWRETPAYQAQFTTAHGERQQAILPDGSMLTLNTATSVTARFYGDRRTVELAQGETLFQVNGAQGTPFIVDTAAGSVKVTGTRFNVRSHSGVFSVGVLEGSVEVTTGPWWNRKTTKLRPGGLTHISAAGELLVQPTGAEHTVAWLEDRIVFRGITLAEALDEINRYTDKPLAVADAKAGQLRLSGVFRTDDLQAFLAALPRIVPVSVRTQGQGTAKIVAR